MAELSIGAAVGSGFELIRRRPLAVLLWGGVELAFAAVLFAVFGSYYLGFFAEALANAQAGATSMPPAALARMMQFQGLSYLANLIGLFVRAVIVCAVFRSVLHPEQGRFGYLRLGAAEFFLFILTVAAYIAVVVALIVTIIAIGLVVAALVVAQAVAAAWIVAVIAGLALMVGLIYLALRFSLVGPMIVEDGRFHLFESWTLTRRRAGGLFVMALCLIAILIVAELIVGVILLTSGMSMLGASAGGLANLPAFFRQPPSAVLANMGPFLIVVAILGIPLTGCAFAVFGAPWARAYRDLAGPDLAATFA